ncbi:hypothetical protein GCM10008910_37650 [Faecalicatena orotica]|uniref:WxL domain-containing protein n=1 Tax=Faecalicatena orotica TaxID=1544 RepID=A0A2Y9BG05_9FIRM|nr:hypothetical protein [Faecalicatena orotica]PWJ30229.1 hypothetical protein A8806_10496 [Faecalicatena orotica]SSA55218.1 hypothetical protein SAMN05216536_10496 [Faecalicatena orotica]
MGSRKRKAAFFHSALLLCGLLLSGIALSGMQAEAAESTEHRTEVGSSGSYVQEGAYTVIIPASVNLTPGESSTVDISVGAKTNIAVGKRLTVRLKETDSVKSGQLTLERYDMAGNVKQTGNEADAVTAALAKRAASDAEFTAVKGTEVITSYSDIASQDTHIGTLQLTPQSELTNTKAGVYKGTVVFTIALEAAK